MSPKKPFPPPAEPEEPLFSTTVRLARRHQIALRREVLERMERGERTDASAIVRGLIDEWAKAKK
jgi:hypothetical protein